MPEPNWPVEPAPEVVMAPTGVYWRRYTGHLSMPPVSDDNDPVLTPLAVYRLVGWEDHDGNFHPLCATCEGHGYGFTNPGAWGFGKRVPCPDCSPGLAANQAPTKEEGTP